MDKLKHCNDLSQDRENRRTWGELFDGRQHPFDAARLTYPVYCIGI
jgi:hypothetical protein